MLNEFSRTELLLGQDGLTTLKSCRVAVFGVGGVGGHAAEALARSGIQSIDLFDNDIVSLTNINRQLIALHSTIGKNKVDVMAERILDINPLAKVRANNCFFLPETELDLSPYDYVIDAVDTVTAKVELARRAFTCGVPIISSMGAGNKLDPTGFIVADINSTSVCPLARIMRKKLKELGIPSLKAVYSKEEPITPGFSEEKKGARPAPGSCAFVPSVVGLIIGGEVVKDLIRIKST